MELGFEPEKKKKLQRSEDKRRPRLDKRIDRTRARHQLAPLEIGTIFLVIVDSVKYLY